MVTVHPTYHINDAIAERLWFIPLSEVKIHPHITCICMLKAPQNYSVICRLRFFSHMPQQLMLRWCGICNCLLVHACLLSFLFFRNSSTQTHCLVHSPYVCCLCLTFDGVFDRQIWAFHSMKNCSKSRFLGSSEPEEIAKKVWDLNNSCLLFLATGHMVDEMPCSFGPCLPDSLRLW